MLSCCTRTICGVGICWTISGSRCAARSVHCRISWPVRFLNIDFQTGLAAITPSSDQLAVVFVAPPWGDALDLTSGLDLARTKPPISEIIDLLAQRCPASPLLCAIQMFERTKSASLDAVRSRFDWSRLVTYTLNAPGHNHGLLMGTRNWSPQRSAAAKPSAQSDDEV